MQNINLKEKRFEVVLFFVWCIITLAGIFHHEPWRDEVQAFLIARDLSIPEIFEQMKYEGHFMLWYLVLKPFSVFGVEFLSVISWGLSAVAYAIFLFYSPFSKTVKTAALFSAPFLFWYPIVSRCYALLPLFLFVTAALFPHRKQHPLLFGFVIAMLANIHVIAEGLVFAVFLFSLYEAWTERTENPKLWLIPLLIFLGVLFAFLTVIRSLYTSVVIPSNSNSILQVLYTLCINYAGWNFLYTTGIPVHLTFAIFVPYGLLFLYLTRSKWALCFFAAALIVFLYGKPLHAAMIVICGMLFLTVCDRRYKLFSTGIILTLLCLFAFAVRFCGLLAQRSFFPYYVLLFFGWTFHDYLLRKDSTAAKQFLNQLSGKLIPLFLLSVIGGFAILQRDLAEPFSGLQETGRFLQSLPSEFQVCAFVKDDSLTAVTAWTKNKIRILQSGIDCTFDPRNVKEKEGFGEKECIQLIEFPGKKVIVMKANENIVKILTNNSYRMIFLSAENPCVQDERYCVFVHKVFLNGNDK